jgi:hypothetical protein
MLNKGCQNKITLVFLLILIFISLTISYCYVSGKNEYKIAAEAMKSNDFDSAATHFSRSIGWYVPYALYVEDSINGMMKIAGNYEMQEQDEDAKYVYNILRGALFSIKSTYSPYQKYLKACNEKLAVLNAKSIVVSEDKESFSKEEEEQLRILNEKGKPDAVWSSVASLSFIGWVLAVIFLIINLFKNNIVNLNFKVIITLLVFAMSYVVWLVSLVKA